MCDTTLSYDRDVKVPLYAAAHVPEVWLVDLVADEVLRYRQPAGGSYGEVTRHGRGDRLEVPGIAGLQLGVDELLPPPGRDVAGG